MAPRIGCGGGIGDYRIRLDVAVEAAIAVAEQEMDGAGRRGVSQHRHAQAVRRRDGPVRRDHDRGAARDARDLQPAHRRPRQGGDIGADPRIDRADAGQQGKNGNGGPHTAAVSKPA